MIHVKILFKVSKSWVTEKTIRRIICVRREREKTEVNLVRDISLIIPKTNVTIISHLNIEKWTRAWLRIKQIKHFYVELSVVKDMSISWFGKYMLTSQNLMKKDKEDSDLSAIDKGSEKY